MNCSPHKKSVWFMFFQKRSKIFVYFQWMVHVLSIFNINLHSNWKIFIYDLAFCWGNLSNSRFDGFIRIQHIVQIELWVTDLPKFFLDISRFSRFGMHILVITNHSQWQQNSAKQANKFWVCGRYIDSGNIYTRFISCDYLITLCFTS